MKNVLTRVTVRIERLCCAVPLEHSQALLAGLHHRRYDIADAPELAAARHDDWQVVYGTSAEQFDVDERTLSQIRENLTGGSSVSVPLLEDVASAALGERVTLASKRPPMTKAWARVYTHSFQALSYELFAADDEDADAQLELLARSLNLPQEISVRWPNGWRGYGWPSNCQMLWMTLGENVQAATFSSVM